MSGRLEEAKGRAKEAAGKVTGDEELEAEGKVEATTAEANRYQKETAHEAREAVKKGVDTTRDH